MFEHRDFNPTTPLKKLWISLPQQDFEVSGETVPSLYGKHRGFIFNYIFVFGLIFLEMFTIFTLKGHGVNLTISIILLAAEFFIACLPLVYEQLKHIKSQVKADKYINSVRIRYIRDMAKPEFSTIKQSIADAKSILTVISAIKIIVNFLIIGLAVTRFMYFYDIYSSHIFFSQIGRLIIFTIGLGIYTHISSTKIVFVDLLMKWFFVKPQIKNYNKNLANRFPQIPQELPHYHVFPINFYESQEKSVQYALSKRAECVQYLGFVCENMSESDEDNKFLIKEFNGGKCLYKKNIENSVASICAINLLIEEDILDLINGQPNDSLKELITAQCKEIQVQQL